VVGENVVALAAAAGLTLVWLSATKSAAAASNRRQRAGAALDMTCPPLIKLIRLD
jgi:hypothetical protein